MTTIRASSSSRCRSPRGKTRIHLDLAVDDIDSAVGRVVALGGCEGAPRRDDGDSVVAVMRDPEGTSLPPVPITDDLLQTASAAEWPLRGFYGPCPVVHRGSCPQGHPRDRPDGACLAAANRSACQSTGSRSTGVPLGRVTRASPSAHGRVAQSQPSGIRPDSTTSNGLPRLHPPRLCCPPTWQACGHGCCADRGVLRLQGC